MLNIFSTWHIIYNFPPKYPFYKKIIVNMVYLFTAIMVHPRKNLLKKSDIVRINFLIKRGDIILLGNLRTIYGLILNKPVTHSAIYVGGSKCIHATVDGVGFVSLVDVLLEYDTFAILRVRGHKKKRRKIAKKAINFAKSQLGQPYDYEFTAGVGKYFCSKLVNDSFLASGYNTGLQSTGSDESNSSIIGELERMKTCLEPDQMVHGNFRIPFLSHNLAMKEGDLSFQTDKVNKQI